MDHNDFQHHVLEVLGTLLKEQREIKTDVQGLQVEMQAQKKELNRQGLKLDTIMKQTAENAELKTQVLEIIEVSKKLDFEIELLKTHLRN
ncbi:hypothetical protein [Lysinibacillus piscis]|uniref:DUF3967 domain-containing protein n=1 Tax=Lysinibacillus piscis TaxID=2518931 RepID=A0ABQ5NLQ6_9BACI|nr:hypothetical protein [Lysinibacillus sp. KH24]GLC89032.1 hypothetical protein LYSBPC_21590 [Lysinibacillus sp. KH24]